MKEIRLQDVEARLRAEARGVRARDGFSRLLHERCMAALRREGLKGAEALPTRRWAVGRVAAAAGVAAAVALGIWLVARAPEMPVTPTPTIANGGVPAIPGNIGPGIDTQATAGAFDERKYAYLDRDAKRLLVFVADQFPKFPSDTGNKGPGSGEPAPK
jgi:hypothetical protein